MDVSALPDALQARLGQIDRLFQPVQGDAAELTLVEASAGRFAIKHARSAFGGECLRREYEALIALAETALPVPRAHVFLDGQSPAGPEAWLLMEYVPGETVEAVLTRTHDATARRAVLRAFGQILCQLHLAPLPPALRALRNEDETWLDQMLRDADVNLAAGRADAEGTAALLEWLRRERPPPVAPALIHGDFTIDNVLLEGSRVTGVIDWSGAAYGDPRYDVALATRPKPAAFRLSADLDAFYTGYGEAPLSERERAYFVALYEFF
jgi:aminoglycoside phosphotransferase (APT) family kinase protein